MKTIKMIINGYHTKEDKYTLLDEDDYYRFCHWKWQESSKGYARRNSCYKDSNGNNKWQVIQLHRAILGVDNIELPNLCVDHINGDKLDNRKCNLRVVNHSTNASNRHIVLSSTNTLCVTEIDGKFMARIRRNKESFYLGIYDSPELAREAIILFEKTGVLPKRIKYIHKVIQKDINGKIICVFNSCSQASRITGINASNISRCANGNSGRKTAGGFVWEYI